MGRRPRQSIVVNATGYRSIKGVDKTQRMLASVPDYVIDAVQPDIKDMGNEMVDLIKEIVPRDPSGPALQSLADSVRTEEGPTDLSIRVVEDGKDEHGKPFAKHVEYGHRDIPFGGIYIPPKPHFWPVYRLIRKLFRGRVARSVGKAVRAVQGPQS